MIQVNALIAEHGRDFSVITVLAIDLVLTVVVLEGLSHNHNLGILNDLDFSVRLNVRSTLLRVVPNQ
jgi:hypothetical protein